MRGIRKIFSYIRVQKLFISFLISCFLLAIVFFSMSVMNLYEALTVSKKEITTDKLVYLPNGILLSNKKK